MIFILSAFLCYTAPHQIPRTETGRIVRSQAVTREFKQRTGYPKGRQGYIIDHVTPLKRGGCDTIQNLQWQTIEEAKAKDKWE